MTNKNNNTSYCIRILNTVISNYEFSSFNDGLTHHHKDRLRPEDLPEEDRVFILTNAFTELSSALTQNLRRAKEAQTRNWELDDFSNSNK